MQVSKSPDKKKSSILNAEQVIHESVLMSTPSLTSKGRQTELSKGTTSSSQDIPGINQFKQMSIDLFHLNVYWVGGEIFETPPPPTQPDIYFLFYHLTCFLRFFLKTDHICNGNFMTKIICKLQFLYFYFIVVMCQKAPLSPYASCLAAIVTGANPSRAPVTSLLLPPSSVSPPSNI